MQRWSKRVLLALGFRVSVCGQPPHGSFIAPNHLSYMDIILLGSVAPQIFLSKREVAFWPVVGAYTRMAGTLFIDRTRRGDVAGRDEQFGRVIREELCMTIFLEGTSTDGREVLPFRSSLLEPVVSNGWSITPAYLRYECDEGDPSQDVCWWGDMTFGGHLLRMIKVKRTRAYISFGQTHPPCLDRKQLARELYEAVLALQGESVVAPTSIAVVE